MDNAAHQHRQRTRYGIIHTEQSPHHPPSKQTHAVPIDTLTMLYHGVSSLIDDVFVDETVEVVPRAPSHLRCQSQTVVQRRDHLKGGSNEQQKGSDLVVFGRHLPLNQRFQKNNSTVRQPSGSGPINNDVVTILSMARIGQILDGSLFRPPQSRPGRRSIVVPLNTINVFYVHVHSTIISYMLMHTWFPILPVLVYTISTHVLYVL